MTRWIKGLGLLAGLAASTACTEADLIEELNLFTIEDDIELGQQLRDEILADSDTYPVLDEGEYPEAYDQLYLWRDEILSSDDVLFAEEFDWEFYIIDDDEVLNAFAAPGGYVFVYTGLMRYLDIEDHLVGVLGHEIAHADRRHSTQQLSKAYGVSLLFEAVLGDDVELISDIAQGLIGLEFSRSDESAADEYSVRYLCDTVYAADGAAGFFEKLEGGSGILEFLSTHPDPDNRVEDITALALELGCDTEPYADGDYEGFLATLP